MNEQYADFINGFIRLCADGWKQGYHERNGGNLSYRLTNAEAAAYAQTPKAGAVWRPIGTEVPTLAGECFLVTGTGKYFQNVERAPEENIGIIKLDDKGENYSVVWGFSTGGLPTSELPTHLMNFAVKVAIDADFRVIYHCHPVNIIALTFVLPLKSKDFTYELWEAMTECPIVFPDGVGVLPWKVPGGRDIAIATSELMKDFNAVVWAHHGLFAVGKNFDETFGLAHTMEKAAEISVKIRSMDSGRNLTIKHQTITRKNFEDLAKAYNVNPKF